MKLAEGPRPLPIHGFALILTTSGLLGLIGGLARLDETQAMLAFDIPYVAWNRDLVIVFLSATFTIVLIPVIAVWAFASKIARILVTIMALPALFTVLAFLWIIARGTDPSLLGPEQGTLLFNNIVILIAVAMLYTRSAARWLSRKEPVEHAAAR